MCSGSTIVYKLLCLLPDAQSSDTEQGTANYIS